MSGREWKHAESVSGVAVDLSDGLYAIVTQDWAAGFVVERGSVTMCAPILRKRLSYWITVARRVPECPPRVD